MKNGYIEKPFGKSKIALKFGTNAFQFLCEMHDTEMIADIDKILQKAGGERDLIFCAAKAAAWGVGKEFKVTVYQIGDWLDEMEQSDYQDIVETLASTRILGTPLKEAAGESK